ncbi:chitobiase/beta-hexosaminidase C-terminal domain-containing protein, partial [bacterium]|nr:chitobiase/beta-hexosaminidase C-terminal domain-containing protein [bacterium]
MKASLTAIAAALACTHFLWADLKVHWPLDESSGALASDSSGEGNDGIWLGSSGSVGWQPTGGIDGGAVSFSGSNRDSFITSSFDSVSGTPFTMSVWVKTTSIANDTMIYLGDAATGNSYNTLKIQGGSARVVVRNTSETQATGPSVRNGQWRHVLGVYNGTDDREIYVDGSLANSNFTDVSDVTLTRFGIGGLTRSTPAAPVDLFTGELDEVALWDRAFDAGDVAALHGLVTLGAGNSADLEAFMVAFSAQSTVGVRGVDWEYVTGLSGGVGTMAGSVSGGDASIVLGGSGQGMRMVGAAAPMITSFTADHEAIASGVPVTLSWQIFNADSATISGVGSVDESGGSVVVSPTTTTTYTLNGLNGDGSDSSAVTITVTGATVDPEIGEFLAKNDTGLQDEDGARSDWIEIHNDSGFALDLAGYKLTNDALLLPMWSFPSRIMGVDERLVVFASSKDRTGAELHTNFTLDADGSYLALVRPNGTTIVQEFSPGYPPQSTDVSYSAEGFYATPTPGEENGPAASGGVLKNKVTFVTPGGLFFGGTVSLALTHPDGAAIIRYTTDGSTPDESSTAYASPISITSTTQVQAGVFRSDFVPGPISQEGYLFANSSLSSFDSDLPILVIDTFNTTLERNDSTFKDAVFTAFEPAVGTGRVALSDMPSVSGNSGIHVRGESSQLGGFNKLNFAFETR